MVDVRFFSSLVSLQQEIGISRKPTTVTTKRQLNNLEALSASVHLSKKYLCQVRALKVYRPNHLKEDFQDSYVERKEDCNLVDAFNKKYLIILKRD